MAVHTPFDDQRSLAAGEAFTLEGERDLVFISGADRARFLDVTLSRSVGALARGESAETMLLDASGHVRWVAGAVGEESHIMLLLSAGWGDDVVDWVRRMRFRLDVDARVERAEWRVIGFMRKAGRPWQDELCARATYVWSDPWRQVQPGGWQYAQGDAAQYEDWTWTEAVIPLDEVPAVLASVEAGGARAVGAGAREALRIVAARPSADSELDDRSIPHELDWLRTAVQLDKGCFPGQETVAKVHNLGHPPRRLSRLQLDGGADDVEAGDAVFVAGQPTQVGTVTAAAAHFEMGLVALAVLRRAAPEDAELDVEHDGRRFAASQEVIVPASAGAVASDSVRSVRRARRSQAT